MTMEVRDLKVAGIKDLSSGHYMLELENSFKNMPVPGQFLHIKVPPFFLRRPFSIAWCDKNIISILFKVAGKGSASMSGLKKGDALNVVGPLGKGFPRNKSWKKIYFVGGGTGVAPLLFLARLEAKEDKETLFFYGAREKSHIIFSIVPAGMHFVFSTEDGSYGEKGRINVSFDRHIEMFGVPDVIYAGGPGGLLQKVALTASGCGVPAFLSLENRMACGTGLCYGCVTKIKKGGGFEYKRVCKDGPVFNVAELVWEKGK